MGLLAPKGTPPAVIDRLQRELAQALASTEVRSYMDAAGIEIVGSTPSEFGTFFRAEKERWAKVIKETGAKVD
jgi:tripartite-type tricarboxylate transporter receptor subunit TctC